MLFLKEAFSNLPDAVSPLTKILWHTFFSYTALSPTGMCYTRSIHTWTTSFMRSCIFQQHPQHTAKCLDKKSTQHINTNTSKHYLQSPAFPFSYTLNLILWLSIKLMPGRNGFCKKYGQRCTACSLRDHWARQNGSCHFGNGQMETATCSLGPSDFYSDVIPFGLASQPPLKKK